MSTSLSMTSKISDKYIIIKYVLYNKVKKFNIQNHKPNPIIISHFAFALPAYFFT